MRVGVFTFGGVEMPDRGAGPPDPTERRFTNEEMWAATESLLRLGVLADRLGFDSFQFTEHHFQHEGYEVTPNALQLATWLAAKTERIRLGAMFTIVPQWNPLRLAEDFATLHNLSGGRGILGVGRGTVPREILHLNPFGVSIGSHDNPGARVDDERNRRLFDEAVSLLVTALTEERFSHVGEHFEIPVPGIPDRGSTVKELTLVPRPLHPFEVWQPITSPGTLETVPRRGFTGVFWNLHHDTVAEWWERYGETYAAVHGSEPGPGERRTIVLNVRVADTREEAIASARPGHDEFWKFLGPYGWSRGYRDADGRPVPPGLVPTLEESLAQRAWIVGTAEDVAEGIAFYRERVGLDYVVLFPQFAGDPFSLAEEQLHRIAEDVIPLLG